MIVLIVMVEDFGNSMEEGGGVDVLDMDVFRGSFTGSNPRPLIEFFLLLRKPKL